MKKLLLPALMLAAFQLNAQSVKVIDNLDSSLGWNTDRRANSIALDESDPKEGKASLKVEGDGMLRFEKKWVDGQDTGITDLKNGILSFWFYISDASLIDGTNGSVEITSSGKADANEYSWSFSGIGLKNGWNKVELKLNRAGSSEEKPDMKSINFFRVYQAFSGSVVTKIDDIRFTNTSGK